MGPSAATCDERDGPTGSNTTHEALPPRQIVDAVSTLKVHIAVSGIKSVVKQALCTLVEICVLAAAVKTLKIVDASSRVNARAWECSVC